MVNAEDCVFNNHLRLAVMLCIDSAGFKPVDSDQKGS